MSENSNPKAFSGIKQTWANPKARKGMLLSAAVVGVVLVVTGLSLKNKAGSAPSIQSNARLETPPTVTSDITASVSADYKAMVVTKDNARAAAAAKTDLDMALPKVIGLSAVKPQLVIEPAAAPVAAPLPAAAPMNPGAAQLTAQSNQQAQAQIDTQTRANPAYLVAGAFMTSAAQQMSAAGRTPFGIIAAPGLGAKTGADANPGAGAKPGATASGPASASTPPAVVVIGAGEALFATIDTAINTDYSGPVVATVRQGRYSGARMIGTKALEYDAVVLKFNVMSLPTGGPAIPIQAVAINLGDVSKYGTTGLQGSTDYHIAQRYVIPAILAFAQTYGYAASMGGSSTTSTATSTNQTVLPLSSKDRALVALGGALGPAASDLAKQATRPITIQMNANTEIGVLFTQDVTDKNAKTAADKASLGINSGYVEEPARVQMSSAGQSGFAVTSTMAPRGISGNSIGTPGFNVGPETQPGTVNSTPNMPAFAR